MGADWVSRFDKRLCDEILSLTQANMPVFVQAHLSHIGTFSEFRCGFEEDVPATVRLQQLRDQGCTEEDLKGDLVEYLCVSVERLALDYWACYAEVFSGDPPGSIPDYKLFPHLKEQRYLLLRPEHLDRMLASLDAHRNEINVMSQEQISQLQRWRDECAQDTGIMVAYFYDY